MEGLRDECQVCGDPHPYASNKILECSGCGCRAHQKCMLEKSRPSSQEDVNWKCLICSSGISPKCLLCSEMVVAPMASARLSPSTGKPQDGAVHVLCAKLCPCATLSREENSISITNSVSSKGKRSICYYCSEVVLGYSIKCKKCNKKSHPCCARQDSFALIEIAKSRARRSSQNIFECHSFSFQCSQHRRGSNLEGHHLPKYKGERLPRSKLKRQVKVSEESESEDSASDHDKGSIYGESDIQSADDIVSCVNEVSSDFEDSIESDDDEQDHDDQSVDMDDFDLQNETSGCFVRDATDPKAKTADEFPQQEYNEVIGLFEECVNSIKNSHLEKISKELGQHFEFCPSSLIPTAVISNLVLQSDFSTALTSKMPTYEKRFVDLKFAKKPKHLKQISEKLRPLKKPTIFIISNLENSNPLTLMHFFESLWLISESNTCGMIWNSSTPIEILSRDFMPQSVMAKLAIKSFNSFQGMKSVKNYLEQIWKSFAEKSDLVFGPAVLGSALNAFYEKSPSHCSLLRSLHLALLDYFFRAGDAENIPSLPSEFFTIVDVLRQSHAVLSKQKESKHCFRMSLISPSEDLALAFEKASMQQIRDFIEFWIHHDIVPDSFTPAFKKVLDDFGTVGTMRRIETIDTPVSTKSNAARRKLLSTANSMNAGKSKTEILQCLIKIVDQVVRSWGNNILPESYINNNFGINKTFPGFHHTSLLKKMKQSTGDLSVAFEVVSRNPVKVPLEYLYEEFLEETQMQKNAHSTARFMSALKAMKHLGMVKSFSQRNEVMVQKLTFSFDNPE